MTRAMSSASGIGVFDAARRVLAEVSLLDRQPPFRLSGRNQLSCPEQTLAGTCLSQAPDRHRAWMLRDVLRRPNGLEQADKADGTVLLLRGLGSSPSKHVPGISVGVPCRIIVLPGRRDSPHRVGSVGLGMSTCPVALTFSSAATVPTQWAATSSRRGTPFPAPDGANASG